ncbi:hypothetical protein [Mesorhizobium sp. B2-3-4]|uniref:hypothetical protein n=1 Tax=Mesorhizobium sp. B2-3-4 TaxID=2589959 RepID=UPI00112C01E0|nr:hypothetical protein [Mesorhizobium sp. B2-3-4]TPM27938.1 hypothetical protein FJ967_30265 [Mesorhizobium sp. B2-3-4]
MAPNKKFERKFTRRQFLYTLFPGRWISGGIDMKSRWKKYVIAAACILPIYLIMVSKAHYSGPDTNYQPICRTAEQVGCVPFPAYVQHRDNCGDKLDREKCFGVGNDGWDTLRMDAWGPNRGLVPQPFEYATLEYDTRGPQAGKLLDRMQLEAIVTELHKLVAEGPVMLVVFAHGWHHNARENIRRIELGGDRPYNQDGNLLAFKHVLAKTKYELGQQDEKEKNRKVFGIYIGWNGGPDTNYLNAGTIGSAADSIGNSEDFAADMARIKAAVNPDGGAVSPVLVIGHSFGGRLLSRYMLNQVKLAHGPVQPFGPRSLVATINPAIGADAFDDFVQAHYPNGSKLPYWINITSSDDWATDLGFPIGASIGRMLGLENGITDKIFPKSAFRSIGHYAPYLTHTLEMPWVPAGKACPKGDACFDVDECFISDREKPDFPFADKYPRQTQWYQIDAGKKEKIAQLFYLNNQCDSRFYLLKLARVGPPDRYGSAPGWMWNVHTNEEGIDAPDKGGSNDCRNDGSDSCQYGCSPDTKLTAAVHNAFVQTRFVRMFLELVLAKSGT